MGRLCASELPLPAEASGIPPQRRTGAGGADAGAADLPCQSGWLGPVCSALGSELSRNPGPLRTAYLLASGLSWISLAD